MRVLILAYTIRPNSGSEPGNAWNLAETLSKLGHAVTVLTQVRNKQFMTSASNFDLIYHDSGVPIHRLRMGTFSVYAHYFIWQRSVSRLLKAKIFEDYDIAHHVSWGTFWLGTGLAQINIPTIFGPCGYQETQWKNLRLYGKSWKIEIIREILLTHFFAKSNFFKKSIQNTTICLSANRQSQQKLMQVANKPSTLFMVEGSRYFRHNALDRILQRDPRDLIWVGRFLPRKGLPLLVKAVNRLKDDFPNLHLTLVGDGADYLKVQNIVNDLKIDSMITFAGSVPHEEIFEFLDKNGLLILPSLRESTGAQIMEAASVGIPTVFFDFIGATTWFDNSTSYIVPSEKNSTEESLVNNLANTIKCAILAEPSEYIGKSNAAFEFASNSGWDKKTKAFIDLYYLAIHKYAEDNFK